MAATADAVPAPGVAPPVLPGVPAIPMRPLAVGEVIDLSWDMVRRWPRVSLSLGALTAVAVALAAIPIGAVVAGAIALIDANSAVGILIALASVAGATFALTALTYTGTAALSGLLAVVVNDAVSGDQPSLGRVRERMRGRWGALVGVSLVVGLIESIAALISSVLFVSIGWILVQPLTAMAGPVTVLERVGPFRALGRTASLSGKDTGRVLLIRMLSNIVQFALSAVIGSFFGAAAVLLLVSGGGSSGLLFGLLFAAGLMGLLGSALIAPFMAFNSGILYADRRMRGEGLDIEVLLANRKRRRNGKRP